MHYFRWTSQEIKNLEEGTGIFVLLTEVDPDGKVIREVGLDAQGNVVHKCPSTSFRHGTYGLFDLLPVDISGWRDRITEADFQKYWHASTDK